MIANQEYTKEQFVDDIEERLRLYRLLSQNPNYAAIMCEAIEVEQNKLKEYAEKGYNYYGFEWFEVHGSPVSLNKLVTEKVLDIALQTRSGTHYRIRNTELLAHALDALTEMPVQTEQAVEIPNDLFSVIVSHDRIKWAFNMSLRSDKPVHILLVGPPATAKSLFLQELSRLPESRYALGSAATKAGIVDYLLEYRPKYLIIDEIEKSSGDDLASLLSLMQTGIVTRLKKNMREQIVITTWVFAGANTLHGIPTELRSRFVVLPLMAYTEQQFKDICTELLRRENVSSELSRYIVDQITPLTRDVRDAVKLARLARSESDVRELVKLIWRPNS